MASFRDTRFATPTFNPNFPLNNFHVNTGMERYPGSQFLRPPNPPCQPIQPPDCAPPRFVHGFQNRPQFSNFPESVDGSSFLNRPPPLSPHTLPLQQHSFPPPSQPPSFPSHRPPLSHHTRNLPPRPPIPPCYSNQPPCLTNQPSGPPNQPPGPPNQPPGPPNQPPGPPNQPPCPPNQHPCLPNQHPCLPNQPPCPPNQPPFPPNQPPFPPNQFPCPPNRSSNPVPHHEVFRFSSPPSISRPQFDSSFQRPGPWNQMSRFAGPRSFFQNRPHTPMPSHQFNSPPHQIFRKKQKTREFRNLKDDSTTKPFSCDTCDRAFVTEYDLKDHLSQHIKCNHRNCTFEAHPKIVALHKKLQHETGYADKINKLKDDAEIKKWREERKRRFPTAENIRKRKAEQAEREARGEVLETKEFGKFKQRREENTNVTNNQGKKFATRNDYRRHRDRRNRERRNFYENRFSRPLKVGSESDSDSDSHITLNMFLGMSSLTNSAGNCNQTEEPEVISTPPVNSDATNIKDQFISSSFLKQNFPKSNSYSDLSCSENNSTHEKNETSFLLNGGELKDCESHKSSMPDTVLNEDFTNSMGDIRPADQSICEIPEDVTEKPREEIILIEEFDDEGPEEVVIEKCRENLDVDNRTVKTVTNITDMPEVSGMEEQKDTMKDNKPQRHHNDMERKFNGFSNERNTFCRARKSTLLEKLLADDIRHERNVILQCIRHIVNNNFFGLAVKKS